METYFNKKTALSQLHLVSLEGNDLATDKGYLRLWTSQMSSLS